MPEIALPPIVLALQVCRRVIRDAAGEHSVIGITEEFLLTSIPMPIQGFHIFAELTGVHGALDLAFRIVEESGDGPPLAEIKSGAMPAKDPLSVAHVAVALEGFVFRHPGEYRLQMWSRGTLLAERRFKISQMNMS